MDFPEYRKQAKVVLSEVQKAREALEAKGAFTDANAATHIIKALEALVKVIDLQGAINN